MVLLERWSCNEKKENGYELDAPRLEPNSLRLNHACTYGSKEFVGFKLVDGAVVGAGHLQLFPDLEVPLLAFPLLECGSFFELLVAEVGSLDDEGIAVFVGKLEGCVDTLGASVVSALPLFALLLLE